MRVFWVAFSYRWMIMEEGSSESGWRNSDISRGLNISTVSDRRSPRQLGADRIGLSGDASHDSGFISRRKERDCVLSWYTKSRKSQLGFSHVYEDDVALDPFIRAIEWGDVSLRHWLDKLERKVDAPECLHIFTQIVAIVNAAHSQGVVVNNVRPSCFVMSSFNRVSFIESVSCSDSGSDSLEDGLNSHTVENKGASSLLDDLDLHRSRLGNEDFLPKGMPTNASQAVLSETSCMQSSSVYATRISLVEDRGGYKGTDRRSVEQAEEKKQTFPMKEILLMETNWYTSPEEISGAQTSCASDIYQLGVLLFELFCTFSSREEKSRTMSCLRHRVLPPQLLLKWPKEASFCLWLLHPEPSSRPKISELLQSEFLTQPRDNLEERKAAIELKERIEEQELLLEFLLLMQQRKQEAVDKLQDTISFLSSDIDEVEKQQATLKKRGGSYQELIKDEQSTTGLSPVNVDENEDSASVGSRKRFRQGGHPIKELDDSLNNGQTLGRNAENPEILNSKSSRLMKNFKKLESAYLLTRRKPTKPSGKSSNKISPLNSNGRGSVVVTERSSVHNMPLKGQYNGDQKSGWINPFLDGLCKYLSFSKLKVKADLKQGDLFNSSNLVCSVSFDRDGELFATAGVNKKIKVFECHSILNEDRDIHYPVVEMACKSKLSNICWNSYIKSQIASSNFEGVVQVWDITRSQVLTEMREHERRVWSIDYSLADPTMLASGSDDCSVKLWSINQGVSVGTIKTKANVCCVQFPPDSSRYLAFGSADHRIYYYDLRNSRMPLCTLNGHSKTVSYVKFVDSTNLVSASTDNTLKLWDLSMCTARGIESLLQSFTGHLNVKNFVGLSVSDGYIATGSETNEVFIYHKAFPMPALTFKFNSMDPGHETDESAQFISSICWRTQSSTLVAANSAGNIKILEMV